MYIVYHTHFYHSAKSGSVYRHRLRHFMTRNLCTVSSAALEVFLRLPEYSVGVGERAQRPQEVDDPVRSEHRPQVVGDAVQSIPVNASADFVGGLSTNDQPYLRGTIKQQYAEL